MNDAADKYAGVLMPFMSLMIDELKANADKGDRPGWLAMSEDQAMLEIYYHAAKLQRAVRDGDMDRVREHAADVANMSMMLLDVCGGLVRQCRECGCTDDDCSSCIQRTGTPCHWLERDLCSACAPGMSS